MISYWEITEDERDVMTILRAICASIFLLATTTLAWGQAGVTTYPAPWGQTGYTTLSVSAASSNVVLPGNIFNGVIANVCNTGTVDAFVAMGNSSGIVATTSGTRIPANQGCVPLNPVGQTYLAGITASSTTTITISVGQGTPFSSLPGGGGGGTGTCATLGGQLGGPCANATIKNWISPYNYGAKCDGSTDDSIALQNWMNGETASIGLQIPQGVCAFATPLTLTNPNKLAMVGAGPYQSVFLYTGAGTTSDIINIGSTAGTATLGIYLANFRVASSTQMTAGAGLHLQKVAQSEVDNVIADGQSGNGNLYNGLWFDQVDSVSLDGHWEARGQNDGLRVDGGASSYQADLYLNGFGKIGQSGVGIHVGGGFGGLNCIATDIIGNTVNVLIDTALQATGNRELFFGPHCIVDSAGQDGYQVNDTLATGATLDLGGWNSSASRYGVNVISWPSSRIAISDGPIFHNGSDGIHIADTSSILNVSIGSQIVSNSGYGINSTGGITVAASPLSFISNTSGANSSNIVLTSPATSSANIFTQNQTINTSTAPFFSGTPILGVQRADGSGPVISYIGSASNPQVASLRTDGTFASPTALANGDTMGVYSWGGYDGSAVQASQAVMKCQAAQAWVHTTTYATACVIQNTPVNGTSLETELQTGGGVATGGAAPKGVGTLNSAASIYLNGTLLLSSAAPTIASGGCTTGSTQSISANNGAAAFAITLGGATCGTTITLTLASAAHGWVCDAHDITTPASNKIEQSAGGSATAVTLTNYVRTTGVAGNFTAADVIAVKCAAY
jgi:Pectate lyase superfamily protein